MGYVATVLRSIVATDASLCGSSPSNATQPPVTQTQRKLQQWRDEAMCCTDGSAASRARGQELCYSAKARAKWLVEKKGLAQDEAKLQVMNEFPGVFAGESQGSRSDAYAQLQQWRGEALCCTNGTAASLKQGEAPCYSADERAEWLVDKKGLSQHDAKLQVMNEVPEGFVQSPDGGTTDGSYNLALGVAQSLDARGAL